MRAEDCAHQHNKLQSQSVSSSTARGIQHQQQPPQPAPQQHPHLLQNLNNHFQNIQQQQIPQDYLQLELPGVGVVMVKEEVLPLSGLEEQRTVRSRSCRLLRKSIMERRQALGLGDISSDDAEGSFSCLSPSGQCELTPEELEKKERRKEQNRRAAKKCRLKKKQIQTNIEGDFARIVQDNLKLEKESSTLKAQIASLKKQLVDHLQSGQCRHLQNTDNAGSAIAAFQTSLHSSTMTCTSAADTDLSVDHLLVSNEDYLRDLGEISPEQTFTDLDSLVSKSQYHNHEDLDVLDLPSIPQPDVNDNFKANVPVQSPSFSPVVLLDRQSVSSVASDSSALSYQSQGFAQVPSVRGGGGSPSMGRDRILSSSLTSSGDYWEDSSPYGQQGIAGIGVPMDCDATDLEDEVFSDRFQGT